MRPLYDADGIRALLRARCEAVGSQQAFAEKHGISKQYLSDVMTGHREPGRAILAALRFCRVVRYSPDRP